MSNCAVCENEFQCIQCIEGFNVLKEYTLIDTDTMCVPACESSRWMFNSQQNFICLNNDIKCPIEYSCYTNNSRECKYIDRIEEGECQFEIPFNADINEVFEYINENIKIYHKYHLNIKIDIGSIVIYSYNDTIIAEVLQFNKTYFTDVTFFKLFSSEGKPIDIAINKRFNISR